MGALAGKVAIVTGAGVTPRGDLTTLEELAELVRWLVSGFSLTRKSRTAPSAEVAEWLVEKEWREGDG